MTLARAYEALEHDAGEWEVTSAMMHHCAGTATGLVRTAEFGLAGMQCGAADAYEAARAHIEFVTRAAARETERSAEALFAVAADFTVVDDQEARRFARLADLEGRD